MKCDVPVTSPALSPAFFAFVAALATMTARIQNQLIVRS
jgi:hypothetical protein